MGERILIADDSPLMCQLLGQELRELGIEHCSTAANGQEAVNLFTAERPDLVFLDINMPVLDGLQALAAIRAIDPNAYVVIASGASQIDKVKAAIRLGAKGFLVKPYGTRKIAETLTRFRAESAAGNGSCAPS